MPDNVLSNLSILRKEFMAQDIANILNLNLIFPPGSLPSQRSDAPSIRYGKDTNSDATDPLKLDADYLASSAEFPTVKISSIAQDYKGLTRYGLSMEFDEDVRRYQSKLDEVVRARNRVAYWLASQRNTLAINAIVDSTWGSGSSLTDDATGGPRVVSTSAAWTGSTINPVADAITAIQTLEDQNGYAYNLTDMWLPIKSYYNFVKYVVDNDSAAWQPDSLGSLVVPAVGPTKFHMVRAYPTGQFTSSAGQVGLGMDMRNPAVTRYFSTVQDGTYTEAGDGLMVHQFDEDRTNKLVYQFWFEEAYVNREPLSVILLDDLD